MSNAEVPIPNQSLNLKAALRTLKFDIPLILGFLPERAPQAPSVSGELHNWN
jgi:hypothetical protein